MVETSAASGSEQAGEQGADLSHGPAVRRLGHGVRSSTRFLEGAQDVVTVAGGLLLLIIAAVLLGTGTYDFFTAIGSGSVITAADNLLDDVLFVLIIVEVVHTVVLSLRSHTLLPQPFIVVGLVAVIRKILFVLGSRSVPVTTADLALYVSMVVVFVAALLAINRLGGGESES